jgi:phage repressor protein C with HTH and peptisase S24 domain
MNNKQQSKLQEIRRKNLEMACEIHSQQADIAAIYGCEPSYISNLIKGKKNIGEKTARKLEECLKKPMHWMDTPQALMPNDESKPLLTTEKTFKHQCRPRVVGTARCGDKGYYMDLEGGDGYLEFHAKPGSVAIKIKGHSMHPAIKEDWFVIIEPEKSPELGEYVLIKFRDGRKMVKELLQKKSDGYLLLSVNSDERITAHHAEIEGIEAISAIVPPSKHKEW